MQIRKFLSRGIPSNHVIESDVISSIGEIERGKLLEEISALLAANSGRTVRDQRPMAIEVDGPSHFYVNSTKYTAYTKLKHRILTSMGYQVVHIPFFEWNKLANNQDKEAYIGSKISDPTPASLY